MAAGLDKLMPAWLRRVAWTAAFAALLARITTKLRELDEPIPEDQPAEWAPLSFESEAAPDGR